MLDDDSAGFGVDFVIDTGTSFANVDRLVETMDSAEGKILADAARIEKATGGMINLAGATASVTTFGAAATRELAASSREIRNTEKAIEGMIRKLDQETAAAGKTREQIRDMKIETLALTAAQQKNTDLADRLLTSARALQAAKDAIAEDRTAREEAAAADALKERELAERAVIEQLRERSKLEAAIARTTGADRPRATDAGASFSALAARERELEIAEDLIEASQRQNSLLAERASIAAALERNTGVDRVRATDAGATYSALAARALEEEAQAARSAQHAYDLFEAAARRGNQAMREAEEAARAAAAAQAAQDASINSLRSSVDPLFAAQQRLSRELENAARLYRAGAIGQDEYERSSASLAGRLDEVQRAQARQANGAGDAANKAKLGASDLTNIFYQVQDIIVSLQGGQKPLTVLMQQGAQLQGIMMQTGASAGDMMRAILSIAIVSTPTSAALATVTAAQAELTAAQTAASATGARAAITAAELAVAEEAAARAGIHDAAAQQALAAAQIEAAGAAGVATAANSRLAAAELAAGEAATAASASARRALAPWLAALIPIGAAFAVTAVAFDRWKDKVEDDAHLKQYAAGLGLTHDEMKKLGDQSITTGDLVSGLWKTVTEGMDVEGKGKSIMDYLFSPDDAKQVQGFVASIYGFFAGGYDAILALWDSMSSTVTAYIAAMGAAAQKFFAPIVSTAQWAATAVGSIFNTVYQWAAGWVKSIAGFLSPILSAIGQGPAATAVASAGTTLGKTFGDAYAKRVAGFVKGSNAFVDRVGANAVDAAQLRLKKKADELIADRSATKPKVDRHAEQLVRDAAAIEAQIRNLYALADAYGVSGAAALVAEARVKAESKAIKQRADIEAAVNREVRLAIAQRVSDAAKTTAGLVDQASAQATVNTLVAGGLVPAERAAELVKDMIADLPLLAAIEAARGRGLADETARATRALDEQRAARDRLTAAERTAQANTAMAAGRDRLAEQREELRLVGATDMQRVRALATLKATQEAQKFNPADRQAYIDQQVAIAVGQQQLAEKQDAYNASLAATADLFDTIDQSAQRAASGMADAFGSVGAAIGDALTVMTGYYADQARLQEAHDAAIRAAGTDEARIARENRLYALRSSSQQIGAFGDMASAARGFFKEGSDGYNALAAAEKAFRLVQFVLSARAIAQDAIETGSKLATSAARTAAGATEAVVNAIKSLPFPLNLAAGAATIAALASIGVGIAGAFGGGGQRPEPSNTGTGTVLGDADAKSESLKRSIDQLREVDTVTSVFARQMAGSLRSIDDQIGGLAAVLVRSGNIDASAGVTEGFQTNAVGSILKAIVPVFGGALASLFGTKTTVVGSGLYGGAQSVGDILGNGFDASTYSDVQKKKKLFGITTSTKYSTQFAAADAGLENQFTLILRSFASAIADAADPLGEATGAVQARLNGFVVNIGKIDLKGLTGTQIQEKLEAVFGAAADGMAEAAFPGLSRFQKAGEGAFETLVRVSSTLEAVTTSLDMLGTGARTMSIDTRLALVDQFDSIGDLTSAVDAYFGSFYSQAEQAAARQAQMDRVFASLGLSVPATNVAFRQLVEAQDLTTAAGQATYAALLQLAPAFAELQSAMVGAKSAADVAAERQDLERQLLELRGDTAAIRALELAKLDASNRGLQEQIYAIQDAQGAAKAADELRQAWTSVGDSIMDEVRRIRGLTDAGGGNTFASLQGAFNAANTAARGGDMEAAKGLPALSQALLSAAADAATSRQELARVQAQTAAALEATYGVVGSLTNQKATSTTAQVSAAAVAQGTTTPATAANDTAAELRAVREEIAGMRRENSSGQAAIAGSLNRVARVLDDVSAEAGGTALTVVQAAA